MGAELRLASARIYGDLDVSGTTVRGEVECWRLEIKGSVWFVGSRLKRDASFREVQVLGCTDFAGARFAGRADFSLARLGRVARFKQAGFRGAADFRQCNADALDLGPDAPSIRFRFNCMEQCGVQFKDVVGAMGFWHFARRAFESSGEREKADATFYLEHVCRVTPRRITCKRPRFTSAVRWMGAAVRWFFDSLFLRWPIGYGASIPRTLLTWAVLILGFGALYTLLPGMLNPFDDNGGIARVFGRALFTSVVCFATAGFGDLSILTPSARALAATQGILGALIMALTVSLIARKFMR